VKAFALEIANAFHFGRIRHLAANAIVVGSLYSGEGTSITWRTE
jgi:hypothetical protein